MLQISFHVNITEIPTDILPQILISNVGGEDLGHLACTCKLFNQIITDLKFIDRHANESQKKYLYKKLILLKDFEGLYDFYDVVLINLSIISKAKYQAEIINAFFDKNEKENTLISTYVRLIRFVKFNKEILFSFMPKVCLSTNKVLRGMGWLEVNLFESLRQRLHAQESLSEEYINFLLSEHKNGDDTPLKLSIIYLNAIAYPNEREKILRRSPKKQYAEILYQIFKQEADYIRFQYANEAPQLNSGQIALCVSLIMTQEYRDYVSFRKGIKAFILSFNRENLFMKRSDLLS